MKGKRRELFGKCILFLKMVKKKSRPIGGNTFFEVERAMGIEPTSSAWKADILADVRCPRMQDELYHVLAQMSSANF